LPGGPGAARISGLPPKPFSFPGFPHFKPSFIFKTGKALSVAPSARAIPYLAPFHSPRIFVFARKPPSPASAIAWQAPLRFRRSQAQRRLERGAYPYSRASVIPGFSGSNVAPVQGISGFKAA
jgi:hypothetical protein